MKKGLMFSQNTINKTQIWVEITKEQFFSTVGKLDVHPNIQPGKWPYTSLWLTPTREIKGKSVGFIPNGSAMEEKKYYVPETCN